TGSASSAWTATRSHSSVPSNGCGPVPRAHAARYASASHAQQRSARTRISSEAALEQCERVPLEHRAIDVGGAEDAAPDRLRGERKQREPDQRDHEQPWIELRVQCAVLLERREALRKPARHVPSDL